MNSAYIVAVIGKQGGNPSVEIRQVDPASCAATHTKRAAWTLANKLGQPVNVRGGVKHGYLPIFFTCLGMTRRLVGKATAANEAPQAVLPVAPVTPAPCAAPAERMATQPQRDLIARLVTERGAGESLNLDTLTFAQAKVAIPALLAAPKKAAEVKVAPVNSTVAEGFYAIECDGECKFYKVEKGKDGTKWEGYTFVKVQASDDLYPVRDKAERVRILAAIAADPKAASILYGQRLGRCGVCSRTLTDDSEGGSIEKGIGPVCEAKMGW